MSGLIRRARALLCRVAVWVMRNELESLWSVQAYHRRDIDSLIAFRTEAYRRLGAAEAVCVQVKALQAVDVNFHDTGKIVVIARVGSQDVVKIVDIPKQTTMVDYKRMVAQIEQLYGARPAFVDMPHGVDPYSWGRPTGR